MKSLPPFNAEEARAEVLAYFRRLAPSMNVYADLNARDKEYFEQCVKDKQKNWPREWSSRQIEKGRQLLESVISSLSKEDQELIEDYLRERIEEACYEESRRNDLNY